MDRPGSAFFKLAKNLIAALLALAIFPVAASASDWADCSSGDPARTIAACTSILATGNVVPPTQRSVALVNRGIAYYDRNELDKAHADFTSAIQLNPKNAEAFHDRGDLQLRQGALEAAIADYTQAIKINGRLASAYNGRGNALREGGNVDKAIEDYNKAMQFDPKSPFAFNGRGNALRDKGQFDKAIADYSKAIEVNPKYATAFIGRANAHSDRLDWTAALKDYDAAIALDPTDPTAYNNRGSAFQNNRQLDKAIADYDRAISLDQKRAAFYFNRALALHLKDNVDGALADYSATIKLDPNYAFAYHNRGLIAQRKGDLDAAISDYTKAIEINPTYAQNFTSRGQAYLLKDIPRRAVDDLQNSIRIDDRQAGAYVSLGEALVKTKAYSQAKVTLDQAIQRDPISPEAYFQRGRLMEQLGRSDQASEDYKRALSFNPGHIGALQAVAGLTPAVTAPPQSQAIAQQQPSKVEQPVKPAGRLNRVALVIGNSTYSGVPNLPNSTNDAKLIAEAFQKIGFHQVIQVENLTRAGLLESLRAFRDLADSADWAVIYFAGHGMEIDGTNYIVPTDAKLIADRDVADETISLARFLESISHAKEMKIVILDACRENPFMNSMKMTTASRTIARGLARVEPDGGTLVAYAAKHGQIALDGKGKNSPFAVALANRILTPDVEIRKLFGQVRDDVLTATNLKQEPFIYGTLGGDDHFINPKSQVGLGSASK